MKLESSMGIKYFFCGIWEYETRILSTLVVKNARTLCFYYFGCDIISILNNKKKQKFYLLYAYHWNKINGCERWAIN